MADPSCRHDTGRNWGPKSSRHSTQPALSPQHEQKTPERDAESEIAALRAELQVERDARMAAEQALEAAHAEIVRLGGAEPITTSESC